MASIPKKEIQITKIFHGKVRTQSLNERKERTGTELVDRVELVVDPEAVEVVVAYLPYQELETSEGSPSYLRLEEKRRGDIGHIL